MSAIGLLLISAVHSFVPKESSPMASSTTTPVTQLQPAGPLDIRWMPRVLQAFYHDVAASKAKVTANDHVSRIKSRFKQDGVAIEDMVSEEYFAIVKRLRPKYSHSMKALHTFSAWYQSHELTADSYNTLPEVAPDKA